jgi:hypothetical protein
MQPNNKLNKRQASYVRDLQPFVGSMTLAYRKGALNEAYPLSRRLDFEPQGRVPLFWDGEVPSNEKLRRKSQPQLDDAQANSMNVNALRLSPQFAYLVCEKYSRDSFHEDDGEWTKDSWINAIAGYFWHLDRLCVPRNSELRLRFSYELHGSLSARYIGVACTLAKALARF